MKIVVAPLQGAVVWQDCNFALTAANRLHRRLMRALRTAAKSPTCAVVEEARIGLVVRWKILVWVRYESQAVKGLRVLPLHLHDLNVQENGIDGRGAIRATT